MVEEKIVRRLRGRGVSASLAWGASCSPRRLRGGATPTQFSHALFDVAEAAAGAGAAHRAAPTPAGSASADG